MRRTRFGGRRGANFPDVGSLFADRYQIEAPLGSGGESVVFRALDTRLNRHVALKLLSPQALDEDGLARFRREAMSVARLSHPGIVTLYDFDQEDGIPYLILELVPGSDLWAMMYENAQRLSINDGLSIIYHVLDALTYAHSLDVVHRDLKPENVMVIDDKLHTKVMDFGLAYIRGQQSRITKEGVISGSAYYISPEVADGQEADNRADLYAVGVMLYEIVTGRLPFYSENSVAVIMQHLHEAPTPPTKFNADLSSALEAVILRLLAKNPRDRYPSATAAKQALIDATQTKTAVTTSIGDNLMQRLKHTYRVGREIEWSRLLQVWQQVRIGSPNAKPIVMLAGEAGSGKTGFAQQFLNEIRLEGAQLLGSSACIIDGDLPYRPFTEIVRERLRDNPVVLNPKMAADLAKLVPEIVEANNITPQPSLTSEAQRLRLFEHITQFFIQLADYPLVIFFDDLHWADTSSISLLQYIVRNVRGHKILIVGTYRPSELDFQHPLDGMLRELTSQDLVETIKLQRLQEEDVVNLVNMVFGDTIPLEFSRTIYENTEGNLFFTKELIKALVEDERIYEDPAGYWNFPSADELELPNSIRSVVGQQLGKLSDDATQLLQAAAVIGREFTFDVLAQVVSFDEDPLTDLIDEALEKQFITEYKRAREESYLFESALVRQTLLENLSQRRQTRLHLKIAKALESRVNVRSNLERIARHYSLGARTDDDIEHAIDYLMQAAEASRAVFALPNAIDLYNQALELTIEGENNDSRRLMLREHRGIVHQQLGDFASAAADLESVLKAEAIQSDPARKREVLLSLGQVYRRSEQFEAAIEMLTAAIESASAAGEERFVANCSYYLGATYWSQRHITKALEHQQEGHEIVQRLGLEDKVTMRVLHGLAECLMRQGNYTEMLPYAEKSLVFAQQLGDLEYHAENLNIIGIAAMNQSRYERAIQLQKECITVAQKAGMKLHHATALSVMGWAQAASGDYQQGLKTLHEALAMSEGHLKGINITMVWDFLGRCYLELGDRERAAEAFGECLSYAQRYAISWSQASHIGHWALIQIQMGNMEISPVLEQTLAVVLGQGDLSYVPHLYHALARMEIAHDNPNSAARWAEKMLDLAEQMAQPEQIARAYWLMAQICLERGEHDDALSHLDSAFDISASLKRPRLLWDLHETSIELAQRINLPDRVLYHSTRIARIIEQLANNLHDEVLRAGLLAHNQTE